MCIRRLSVICHLVPIVLATLVLFMKSRVSSGFSFRFFGMKQICIHLTFRPSDLLLKHHCFGIT